MHVYGTDTHTRTHTLRLKQLKAKDNCECGAAVLHLPHNAGC